jgi:hypothetical protein
VLLAAQRVRLARPAQPVKRQQASRMMPASALALASRPEAPPGVQQMLQALPAPQAEPERLARS